MVAIFVLLTFVVFILVDGIVLKVQKKKHPAFADNTVKAVFNKQSILVPEKIFISKGHTWAELQQDGLIKVGIDDLVVKALGKLKINFVLKEGIKVNQGEIVISGSANGNIFNFRSPVSGVIKKLNKNLLDRPLENPYSDWGIILEPDNFEKSKSILKTGSDVTGWLKNEFSRLKDFLENYPLKPGLAGVTMHDGGNIVEGALININSDSLKNFETEFLTF
jgi:glycine cleavage system H protein